MVSSDLIAPALIIVMLFIINAGVLFFILKARKKQEKENPTDMELGQLPANLPVE